MLTKYNSKFIQADRVTRTITDYYFVFAAMDLSKMGDPDFPIKHTAGNKPYNTVMTFNIPAKIAVSDYNNFMYSLAYDGDIAADIMPIQAIGIDEITYKYTMTLQDFKRYGKKEEIVESAPAPLAMDNTETK